jgi:hypothetical protein
MHKQLCIGTMVAVSDCVVYIWSQIEDLTILLVCGDATAIDVQ